MAQGRVIAAVLLTATLSASHAWGADSVPAPASQEPTYLYRQGPVLGLGLGGGTVGFSGESHRGLAYCYDIGWMVTPRLALLVDGGGSLYEVRTPHQRASAHEINFEIETTTAIGGAIQYFFNERLWARAGLGSAWIALADNVEGREMGSAHRAFAFLGAAGVDLLQARNGFALDLQVRYTRASFARVRTMNHWAFLLGFNFNTTRVGGVKAE
jgi:hypothetical protein